MRVFDDLVWRYSTKSSTIRPRKGRRRRNRNRQNINQIRPGSLLSFGRSTVHRLTSQSFIPTLVCGFCVSDLKVRTEPKDSNPGLHTHRPTQTAHHANSLAPIAHFGPSPSRLPQLVTQLMHAIYETHLCDYSRRVSPISVAPPGVLMWRMRLREPQDSGMAEVMD